MSKESAQDAKWNRSRETTTDLASVIQPEDLSRIATHHAPGAQADADHGTVTQVAVDRPRR